MSKTAPKPLERTYEEGAILFHEKDPGGDIYLIRSGLVEVFRTRGGREWSLARLGKDEILGSMSATTKAPRAASARALETTEVVVIPHSQLEKLIKTMPHWGLALIKDLVARVQYCSNLYMEAASINHAQPSDDPLAMACLVASSLGPVLGMMRGNHKTVPLVDLSVKIAEVLGSTPNRVNDIIVVFMEEQLLAAKDGDKKDHQSFDADSVNSLQDFLVFVRELKDRPLQTEEVVPLLAINERKLLLALGLAAVKSSDKPGEQGHFLLSALRSELNASLASQIDSPLLKRAESLKYLAVTEDETPQLVFIPNRLVTLMRCYEVVKRINPKILADANLKKTLLY